MPKISEARVLIMATDGFEESELFGPRQILMGLGCEVKLASPDGKPIQATVHDDPGRVIRPDLAIADVDETQFDALILPGGVRNPDSLRTNRQAIALIRAFNSAGKPIGAICHGPWLLAEADVVRGRTVSCWPSICTDLANAGATIVDEAAAVDGNLVTSRMPADIRRFTEALIALVERP